MEFRETDANRYRCVEWISVRRCHGCGTRQAAPILRRETQGGGGAIRESKRSGSSADLGRDRRRLPGTARQPPEPKTPTQRLDGLRPIAVVADDLDHVLLRRSFLPDRAALPGSRATASTVLNEAQFNRDWIETQLAHTDRSIRGVYNSAQWLTGRRKMMCWWANFIDRKRRI